MKTYFIGLGGSGLRTVSEIQKRLSVIPGWDNDYEFTYIDTDQKTYNTINKDKIVIKAPDFMNMGDTNPRAVYDNIISKPNKDAVEKRFMEWVISQEPGHMVLPNQPLTDGATAQRGVGRVAIYNKYDVIRSELNDKIKKFQSSVINPDTGTRDVDIWVVASACGGTGSSNLLDILYLINELANPVVAGTGEPNLKLVLFMPQAYVDKNKGNYNHPLNAYSCLWEINAFRNAFENGNGKTFEMFAARPTEMTKPILDFPLYKFAVPVDVETDRDTKLNLDTNFYPTIAEMIYYLSYGTGAAALCSNLSNDVARLRGRNGITNSLIGYGFRAIRKPNKELKDYLETRGTYEILKYGLLDRNHLGTVGETKISFANQCILSKLTTISEPNFTMDNTTYDFSDIVLDEGSLLSKVTNLINSIVKYDPTALDQDMLKLQLKKLADLEGNQDLDNYKTVIFEEIKRAIDRGIDETIINYGLEFAYDLLNSVDDFYLEPLSKHIKETIIPDFNTKLAICKSKCDNYAEQGFRKGKFEEVGKALKSYKDTLTNYIVLNKAYDIIRDLTVAPNGYLEVIRKGDRTNHAGLAKLKTQVSALCTEYETEYSELAKSFRTTKSDAMTLFLPSLADIATGPNNIDWKPDNFFDTLYQGSILEQEQIDRGLERLFVPKRSDVSGHCLSNYLTMLDPDINLFSNIIKDKDLNLITNVERNIRVALENIIKRQASDPQTTAGQFLNCELKDIPQYYPQALPRDIYNDFDAFYNDFKTIDKIPVFFPLKGGETMPSSMRLMFVGNDLNLATNLGYSSTNNNHQWVQDDTMKDRFMVLRMPIGLSFDKYKYFTEYENTYKNETLNAQVKNKYYGCHIHQIFNESNDFQEIIVRKRLEKLIKCLFYQHLTDIWKKEDSISYSKIFGLTTQSISITETEGLKIEGLDEIIGENGATNDTENNSMFISIVPDFIKREIVIKLKPLLFDNNTNQLSINNNEGQVLTFNETETIYAKNFVDRLITVSDKLFNAAEMISGLIDRDESLAERVRVCKDRAKQELLKSCVTDDGKITNRFAAALYLWTKRGMLNDKPIIGTIESIIKSL